MLLAKTPVKLLSLNHYWRIVAAAISYTLFAIGAFFPVLHALLLSVSSLNTAQKQKKIRKTIQRLCKFYVDFMQFVGIMTYDLVWEDKAAIHGKVIISNHTMLIDALFVLAYVEDICCVAKEELHRNPVTRLTVKLAGYISNNEEDLIEVAASKLALGENILIFPEGTRNRYDTQLDFKRGAANIAIQAQADILPIILLCNPRALQKFDKWYQLPAVKSKILMRIDPILPLAECIDVELPRTIQYRRLTDFFRAYYLREISALSSN